MRGDLHLTIHDLRPLDLAVAGFDPEDVGRLLSASGTGTAMTIDREPPTAGRGAGLYAQFGCATCHSVDGPLEGELGPTFKGLYGAVRMLENGGEVIADDVYLRESILEPDVKRIAGYDEAMASYRGVLTDADVTSLVLFIRSLADEP